jgi:hypothetical protein
MLGAREAAPPYPNVATTVIQPWIVGGALLFLLLIHLHLFLLSPLTPFSPPN